MSASLPNVEEVRDNLRKIQKNLECPICLELLSDPYTTHCSHPFCRTCIYTVILSNKNAKCPLCKESISKRSMNENTRLGEIVEAVKDLEQAITKDSGVTRTPPRAQFAHSREASGTPGLIMHSLLHPTPKKKFSKRCGSDGECLVEAPERAVNTHTSSSPCSSRGRHSHTATDPHSPSPPLAGSSSVSAGPVLKRRRRVRFATARSATKTRKSARKRTSDNQSSSMSTEHRAALLDAIENADFEQHRISDERAESRETTSDGKCPQTSTESGTKHELDRPSGPCLTPQLEGEGHTHRQQSVTETPSIAGLGVTQSNTTTVLETPFVRLTENQDTTSKGESCVSGDTNAVLAEETQPLSCVQHSPISLSPGKSQIQSVSETQFNTSLPPQPTPLSPTGSVPPADGGEKSCDNHVISPSISLATQTIVIDETQLTKVHISPTLEHTQSLKESEISSNPQIEEQKSLPFNSTGQVSSTLDIQNVSAVDLASNGSNDSPVIPLQNIPRTPSHVPSPSPLLNEDINPQDTVDTITQGGTSPPVSCSAVSRVTETQFKSEVVPASQPSPTPFTPQECLPRLRSQFGRRSHTLRGTLSLDSQILLSSSNTQSVSLYSSLLHSQDLTSQELEALKVQAEDKEREIRELEAAILAAKKQQELQANKTGDLTNTDGYVSDENVEAASEREREGMTAEVSSEKELEETVGVPILLPGQHKTDECTCIPASFDSTTVVTETAPESLSTGVTTSSDSPCGETPIESSGGGRMEPTTPVTDHDKVAESEIGTATDAVCPLGSHKKAEHNTSSPPDTKTEPSISSPPRITPSASKSKSKRRRSRNNTNTSRRRKSKSAVVESQGASSEEVKIISFKRPTSKASMMSPTTAATSTLSCSSTKGVGTSSHPLMVQADELLRKLRSPPTVVLKEQSTLDVDDGFFENRPTTRTPGEKEKGKGSIYFTRSQSKGTSKTPSAGKTVASDVARQRKRLSSTAPAKTGRPSKRRKLSVTTSSLSARKLPVVPLESNVKEVVEPCETPPCTSNLPQEGGQITSTPSTSRLRPTIVETPNIRLSGERRDESSPKCLVLSSSSSPLSFVGSGLTKTQLRQAQVLAKSHGGRIASCFNGNTTHVIVHADENGLCSRTVKYLQGVAAGRWIVHYQWIEDSLQAARLLPESGYEVKGDRVVAMSEAPRHARLKRLNGDPGLFVGCTFLLLGNYGNLTPDHLAQLIQLSDGAVLPSLEEARHCSQRVLVVCDDDCLRSVSGVAGCTCITSGWVLDSLSKFSWQSLDPS